MNTFVGFNLKRLESNDDEGFMLQRILFEEAGFQGIIFMVGFQRVVLMILEERWIRKVLVRLLLGIQVCLCLHCAEKED